MLAMWLDEISVALATDSKMTGTDNKVTKLHRVHPDRVMFGIGFGDGAFDWLRACPYYREPYPEYWRVCSAAESVEELERFIRNDLKGGRFPENAHLELCLAGVNEHGILEAFILSGTGDRVKELVRGGVIFNNTSKYVTSKTAQVIAAIPGIDPTNLFWGPEERFWALKKVKDKGKVEFSGAEALKEISGRLIDFCEQNEHPSIGGPLQYHRIVYGDIELWKLQQGM
jgi:hypothetical protein